MSTIEKKTIINKAGKKMTFNIKKKVTASNGKKFIITPKVVKPVAKPVVKKAVVKKSSGRTKIIRKFDSEELWGIKRLMGSDGPKTETLWLGPNGSVFDNATGGRAQGKVTGKKLMFKGGAGALELSELSPGVYYNKGEYRKDWWLGKNPRHGSGGDWSEDMSTAGFRWNLF
mgnify:CR=1 FL=1|tara:strand:+ start:152 stop:667 length:516 start_codon:yes stop_codon:yes gene_type:complete